MRSTYAGFTLLGAGLAGLFLWIQAGCQKPGSVADTGADVQASTSQPAEVQLAMAIPEKGGAQLWRENCMRCHNLRQPRERRDKEWDLIVHQMRVRANLTGREHRLILQFLQSAN